MDMGDAANAMDGGSPPATERTTAGASDGSFGAAPSQAGDMGTWPAAASPSPASSPPPPLHRAAQNFSNDPLELDLDEILPPEIRALVGGALA